MTQQRKRILLVGAAGVVRRCVHSLLKNEYDIITAGLAGADLVFDLADAAAVVRVLNDIGPLDAVISTAGRANFVHLEAVQPNALADSPYGRGLTDKLLGQVNLALAARAVLRPGASITLTSGTTSDDPVIGGSALSMVNGAPEHWVRPAATELPHGLRINVVSPSLVEGTPPQALAAFPGIEVVSAHRVGLAYLRCLASGITGQVIRV